MKVNKMMRSMSTSVYDLKSAMHVPLLVLGMTESTTKLA